MTETPEDASSPIDAPEDQDGQEDSSPEVETSEPGDIGDDKLPEDLRPTEDNPLARHPERTGEDDDTIGADREEAPETAPLHEGAADYGSGARSDDSDSSGGDGPQDGRVDAEEDDGSATLDNGGGGAG